MLNYSLPCSCSQNLSSVSFVIKQKLTTKEISIFSNSRHFEWRAGLSDTILKGDHPSQICFNLVEPFSGFRGKDLNVIFHQNMSLGTYLVLRRIRNPIDFQGQRSRSPGQIFRGGDMPRFALPLL
jgi:hypothetical protein